MVRALLFYCIILRIRRNAMGYNAVLEPSGHVDEFLRQHMKRGLRVCGSGPLKIYNSDLSIIEYGVYRFHLINRKSVAPGIAPGALDIDQADFRVRKRRKRGGQVDLPTG